MNLDQKQPGFPAHVLPDYLTHIGVPFHIEERDTYSIVKRLIPEGQTTCSLCSRLRRGHLYRVATELGATKIALGHHRDDIVETLFLNLFYAGKLKTMPPKLRSKDGRQVVIRPLSAVRESDLAQYAELRAFPIIPCGLCGSQEGLKRKQVKEFLREWEQRSPGCTDSMFAALSNVSLPFLLDRRLFDFVAYAHPIRQRGMKMSGSTTRTISDRRPSPRLLHHDTRFPEKDSRALVRRSRTRYVLSFAEYSLRNLATFGATTAVQYPWNGFREKYS